MSENAWGTNETQFFYDLTPENVLNTIEQNSTFKCTGRVLTLNSMENRVYEVEIEIGDDTTAVIAKFYRPGRWSAEQITAEHEFLQDLEEQEIPVIAPFVLANNKTLAQMQESQIYFCLFPKQGGRSPDELNQQQYQILGRLLARMHNVGAVKPAASRITISPKSYGEINLQTLIESNALPIDIESAYKNVVTEICVRSEALFANIKNIRIHGDCHLGNLLDGRNGLYWVDFDDMLIGPAIQDLWLLVPGGDPDYVVKQNYDLLLDSYRQLREFDYKELKLVEPLRALRIIHFSAWIQKRWDDKAFKTNFSYFGTSSYWQENLKSLADQLEKIKKL